MYDVNPGDIITHKDASKSRKVLDSEFEESLVDAMKRFKVLDHSHERYQLINMITKDKTRSYQRFVTIFSAFGSNTVGGFCFRSFNSKQRNRYIKCSFAPCFEKKKIL
jgi:hypothetical protein